eukprot:scaffold85894_cov67-Phaeocystis_antarctica.AAC.15
MLLQLPLIGQHRIGKQQELQGVDTGFQGCELRADRVVHAAAAAATTAATAITTAATDIAAATAIAAAAAAAAITAAAATDGIDAHERAPRHVSP